MLLELRFSVGGIAGEPETRRRRIVNLAEIVLEARDFFAVTGLPNTYVCDGSILRAAGIANSGLTLVALTYRLAEHLRAAT